MCIEQNQKLGLLRHKTAFVGLVSILNSQRKRLSRRKKGIFPRVQKRLQRLNLNVLLDLSQCGVLVQLASCAMYHSAGLRSRQCARHQGDGHDTSTVCPGACHR
jgi:hypothetical protein